MGCLLILPAAAVSKPSVCGSPLRSEDTADVLWRAICAENPADVPAGNLNRVYCDEFIVCGWLFSYAGGRTMR